MENINLEQKLEKKLNDVRSFSNSIDIIKEMITYFKDRDNKSKKKNRKYETITTLLKSFDAFAIIATTSSCVTLSITRIGRIIYQ